MNTTTLLYASNLAAISTVVDPNREAMFKAISAQERDVQLRERSTSSSLRSSSSERPERSACNNWTPWFGTPVLFVAERELDTLPLSQQLIRLRSIAPANWIRDLLRLTTCKGDKWHHRGSLLVIYVCIIMITISIIAKRINTCNDQKIYSHGIFSMCQWDAPAPSSASSPSSYVQRWWRSHSGQAALAAR